MICHGAAVSKEASDFILEHHQAFVFVSDVVVYVEADFPLVFLPGLDAQDENLTFVSVLMDNFNELNALLEGRIFKNDADVNVVSIHTFKFLMFLSEVDVAIKY